MKRSQCTSIGITLLAMCLHLAMGYPNGPPVYTCKFMKPGTIPGQEGPVGHTSAPQNNWPTYGRTAAPPYYVQVHKSLPEYTAGEKFKISIVANQTFGHNYYKGLLLQARRVTCYTDPLTVGVEDAPLGSFTLIGQVSKDTLLQTLDCEESSKSALKHFSPQFKINETAWYNVPEGLTGHFIFKATIVQYGPVHWSNLYSRVVRAPGEADPPVCATCSLRHSLLVIFLATLLGLVVNL